MLNIELTNITSPIEKELDIFSSKFKASLKSKVGLVDVVTNYILRQKGKKIRPLLVLHAAQICGGINERSFRGATLVEMLHTATLVHDDVVDNADKRRGLPSINAIWKNKISILMGDYLLAKGLMIAVDGKDFDFLGIMTDTVKRMSEGELLQISKTRKLDIDEETYFRIISDKTASLLSTCCQIGAVSASDDSAKHIAMREYGENLGIAFQIRDDILDYVGKTSLFGKPVGGDIKEKKITLPLIHSLRSVEKKEAKKIIKTIKNGSNRTDIKTVIDFVKEKDGIPFSEKIALEYANKARESLNIFPQSENKDALLSLVDYVIQRKK